jgi:hypothetical protein
MIAVPAPISSEAGVQSRTGTLIDALFSARTDFFTKMTGTCFKGSAVTAKPEIERWFYGALCQYLL